MPLVELILVACLLKEPAHCESFHIPFQGELSVMQCAWQSQFRVAEWAGEHPAWRVRRYSCEMPET